MRIGKSRALFRILPAAVPGGSLVVGTSLDQVTKTTGQVELVVTLGSAAVVLLIGLGVFVVVRRGLRPIWFEPNTCHHQQNGPWPGDSPGSRV